MSEQDNEYREPTEDDLPQDDEVNQADELSVLKDRARMMGITFSNNIGVESLKERIAAKMAENNAKAESAAPAQAPAAAAPAVNPLNIDDAGKVKNESHAPAASGKTKTLRQLALEQGMRLVRLRIVNLDPKKKDLPGEIITVANEHLGTVTKFVPFGETTDEGYHVPYCIYKMLKNRKFLNIQTTIDRKNNNQIKVTQRWSPEFGLEVLDPLTPQELRDLGRAQLAAGN